jgi:hypothetical protein
MRMQCKHCSIESLKKTLRNHFQEQQDDDEGF